MCAAHTPVTFRWTHRDSAVLLIRAGQFKLSAEQRSLKMTFSKNYSWNYLAASCNNSVYGDTETGSSSPEQDWADLSMTWVLLRPCSPLKTLCWDCLIILECQGTAQSCPDGLMSIQMDLIHSLQREYFAVWFFKIILKDWIRRRAIPSVLTMMCCPLHGSAAVLEHVWLAWGKRLATTAVVGCHPFVTHTYRGIKHVFQANGYETCCPGALRLMNLWLQPSGSWL